MRILAIYRPFVYIQCVREITPCEPALKYKYIDRNRKPNSPVYREELSTNVTVPLRHSVDQQQRRNDAEMAQDQRRHPAFDVRIRGRRQRTPKEPAKTRFYRSQPRRGKNVKIDPEESHGRVGRLTTKMSDL